MKKIFNFDQYINESAKEDELAFNAYLKSELIDNDLTADVVTDEEIQEYIDINKLGISTDTLRNNADKYVTDEFVEFMKGQDNYREMKLESYLDKED